MSNAVFPGRVIITSARSIMSLVVANSLGKHNIEIIGAGCVEVSMLSFSKYVHQHELYANYLFDQDQFLDDLEIIIKKHKPTDNRPYLLMPIFKETTLIAEHRHRFEPYIRIAAPSADAIFQLHPKQHFARTAKKLNVSIPRTFIPESADQLKEMQHKIDFPVLIKPYDESGGKGIKKVYSALELQKAFSENFRLFNGPSLVQELVEGEDYCFTALFQNGEMKASMAYKNIHRFPAESGSGVMRETVDDQPFLEEAKKLMGPIKWNGVAQVDFMWNGTLDQIPKVIEVNPRFWAGLFQSVQSGIDYPWLNYLLFTEQTMPPVPKAKVGQQTKLPFASVLSILEESVTIDKSLQDIKKTGQQAIEILQENKSLSQALQFIMKGSVKNIHGPLNIKNFKSKLQDSRNAENEIFYKEDPHAAFGIVYSLVYWIKYKKLPPEVGL